jgi:hypothetical protein
MDHSVIREEHEILEHQKVRIEEILAGRFVSPEIARGLRQRLEYISQRMMVMRVSRQPTEEAVRLGDI